MSFKCCLENKEHNIETLSWQHHNNTIGLVLARYRDVVMNRNTVNLTCSLSSQNCMLESRHLWKGNLLVMILRCVKHKAGHRSLLHVANQLVVVL